MVIKNPKLGTCACFRIETFKGDWGRKTVTIMEVLLYKKNFWTSQGDANMILKGCPKDVGSTIIIRGAEHDDLVKAKRVLQVSAQIKKKTKTQHIQFSLPSMLLIIYILNIESSSRHQATQKVRSFLVGLLCNHLSQYTSKSWVEFHSWWTHSTDGKKS